MNWITSEDFPEDKLSVQAVNDVGSSSNTHQLNGHQGPRFFSSSSSRRPAWFQDNRGADDREEAGEMKVCVKYEKGRLGVATAILWE